MNLIITYMVCLSIITFIAFGIDKWKAKAHAWRIPEATLLFLAFIGGACGAWLGMQTFRHKTQHLKFKYGVPLLIIWNIAVILYILHPHACY